MSYEVLILRRAQRQLRRLPTRDYQRIKASIFALGEMPRPHGCLKLSNRPGWRIRIGDYRVIYEIDDERRIVTVMASVTGATFTIKLWPGLIKIPT